jgi:TatA/E family protein of Tat protein translocase
MALGATEIIILFIAALFLFGAKKIPELARSAGQAKGEFEAGLRQGMSKSAAESDMDRGGKTESYVAEEE